MFIIYKALTLSLLTLLYKKIRLTFLVMVFRNKIEHALLRVNIEKLTNEIRIYKVLDMSSMCKVNRI